mgnify:FL=1
MTSELKIPVGTVKVTMRHDQCRCGCNGRDPWHARTLTRKVRDVVVADFDALQRERFVLVATGNISHPSGESVPVKCEAYINDRGTICVTGWSRA